MIDFIDGGNIGAEFLFKEFNFTSQLTILELQILTIAT